ncbi:MAG: cation transporter [Candidatus Obscuribacterales bacterium]|nr:cation transporter [Candidatus Obscuribacterales bacterium]
MTSHSTQIPERSVFVKRGRRLEIFTVVWNSLEGLVAIASGIIASSIALVGFGFDSGIEVLSGLVLLARLSLDHNESRRERIEKISVRLVGLSFFILSAYVGFDSVSMILNHEPPQKSVFGIALALLSLLVMPWLAKEKRKVASAINSGALMADAKQTDFCVYLSVILLAGLLLNALFGFWWADPLAAIIMVPIIAKEGWEGVRGKSCCESCP